MAIRIRRRAYPAYHRNGYNFRDSIQDPDSQLRKVIRILDRDGCIDRHTYFMETRVHSDGDFSAMYIDDGGQLRVRSGYGATFWTALRRAKVIEPTKHRTDLGYMIYSPGDEFNFWYRLSEFFTKTHWDYHWHYGGYIPEGWERAPEDWNPSYRDPVNHP